MASKLKMPEFKIGFKREPKPIENIRTIGPRDLKMMSYMEDTNAVKESLFWRKTVPDPIADCPNEYSLDNMFSEAKHERRLAEKEQRVELQLIRRRNLLNEYREKEFERIQSDLHAKFEQTNLFLRTCQEKRKLAERKMDEEFKKQTKFREEIEEMRKKEEALQELHDHLQEEVKNLEPYEKLLEEVVEELDDCDTVDELIARCDSLLFCQHEIQTLSDQKHKEIEEMRQKIVDLTKQTSLELMAMKTQLEQISKEHVKAVNDTRMFERRLAESKNAIAKRVEGAATTYNAIHNMYRLLCNRYGVHMSSSGNIAYELNFIKEKMEIIREVQETEDTPSAILMKRTVRRY